MAALQPGGYSAEQLIDTMFAFDVSAGEARTIIEAGLALQTTAGAAVLDFARRDS